MSPEQVTLPAAELVEQVIVDVFWRSTDQQAVTDLLGILILSPPVTAFAKWYLIPLLGFVVIAGFGELFAMPDILDALFKNVAHISRTYAIEAAKSNAAVIMNGH